MGLNEGPLVPVNAPYYRAHGLGNAALVWDQKVQLHICLPLT